MGSGPQPEFQPASYDVAGAGASGASGRGASIVNGTYASIGGGGSDTHNAMQAFGSNVVDGDDGGYMLTSATGATPGPSTGMVGTYTLQHLRRGIFDSLNGCPRPTHCCDLHILGVPAPVRHSCTGARSDLWRGVARSIVLRAAQCWQAGRVQRLLSRHGRVRQRLRRQVRRTQQSFHKWRLVGKLSSLKLRGTPPRPSVR